MNRRTFFKGLASVAGAIALKPLLPKDSPINIDKELIRQTSGKMITMTTTTGDNGWFEKSYLNDRLAERWKYPQTAQYFYKGRKTEN